MIEYSFYFLIKKLHQKKHCTTWKKFVINNMLKNLECLSCQHDWFYVSFYILYLLLDNFLQDINYVLSSFDWNIFLISYTYS
jgi:hypothetical protein